MRILIFSNTYKPAINGVVTSVALFRQGLVEAGHADWVVPLGEVAGKITELVKHNGHGAN